MGLQARGRSMGLDRVTLARIADWLMVAVAASLPWSTSATAILVVLWLFALVPTLEWANLRRELAHPAGCLPVLLFALGVLGMTWANVPWVARWHGLDSFFKLLVIPLLFAQFRRSDRGMYMFGAYLAACVTLLITTTLFVGVGGDNVLGKEFGDAKWGIRYLHFRSAFLSARMHPATAMDLAARFG